MIQSLDGNLMVVEIESAVDSDLEEILSLVNKVVADWFIKIIPKEHYKEPFLSLKQFKQMATFMEFFVIRKEDRIIAVGSFSSSSYRLQREWYSRRMGYRQRCKSRLQRQSYS